MKKKNVLEISWSIQRILTIYAQARNRIRTFGTDQALYGAEINIIGHIKKSSGINVTMLAKETGITKGAVSQLLNKLERKGMIVKSVDKRNQSRLNLSLTNKGETVFLNHERMHESFDRGIHKLLEGAAAENIEFLNKFLNELRMKMENFSDK